jgi:hypothetical protein
MTVGRATISPDSLTTGRGRSEPTARMAACGGLITAEKLSTLVRLDLGERLALLDEVTLRDEPLQDGALFHRVRQARHGDL